MTRFQWNKMHTVLTFLCLSLTLEIVLCDSFYGTSYVHLPLGDEEPTVTEIGLNFRTSRIKGLMLKACGETDLFLVRLREGRVEVVVGPTDAPETLLSKKRPKLNNLRWHEVRVTLSGGRVILYIDDEMKVSRTVDWDSLTVNDVHVGGMGDTHLTRSDKFFRGCIQSVMLGSLDVLALSQTTSNATYHDVTRDCSLEFEAGIDDPISFVKETALIQFPKWHINDEGSFACWIRTSAPLGLLMFSYQGNQFLAAEISGGHIRVLIKDASYSAPMAVISGITVNDMSWHFVKLDFASSYLRISIDHQPEEFNLSDPFTGASNFVGNMYVGGVIIRARTLAYDSDLHSITHASTGGSFKGCVQDIELNGVQNALGDSLVTLGIDVGCLYEFPCSSNPCKADQLCTETGPTTFHCECTGDNCPEASSSAPDPATFDIVKRATTMSSRTSSLSTPVYTTPPFELFSVEPLSVIEGGEARVTMTSDQFNIELRKYNLRESQVLFKMSRPPLFGRIEKVLLGRGGFSGQFTFLDLLNGKISYVHDGSENFEDHAVFDVLLSGRTSSSIPNFSEAENFTLSVVITPVNDAPAIIISDDDTFRLIENTQRALPPTLLQVQDPDTPSSEVILTTINPQGNVGHFELNDDAGISITEFTQEDIDGGNVVYVHTGPSMKSRIILRASDGIDQSGLASFRIEAAQLSLEVANLSAIRTNPGTVCIISPSNLKMRTNDPDDGFEVSYQIMVRPRLGEVQKLETSDQWVATSTFSSTDIQRGSVRYFASRAPSASHVVRDQIGLTASSGPVSVPGIFLPVEIVVTSLEVTINTGLVLDIVSEGFISSQNLSSEAQNVLDGSSIVYYLVRTPSHGDVFKHLIGELQVGQNFTQQDVDDGLVGYRLRGEHTNSFNDTFIFRAMVSTVQTEAHEFVIAYFPDSLNIDITNTGILVNEGESYIFSPSELFLRTEATVDFTFSVILSPVNGVLQLKDTSTGRILNSNVTTFLSLDISRGALQYVHDDSETTSDLFGIEATATFHNRLGRRKQLSYSGTVNITVELQNDHSPVRTVDKVFHVIKNGLTLLTVNDLYYTDADSDFDDGELLYQRQRTSAGDIVKTSNPSQSVFRFKQKDLAAGDISFQHSGNGDGGRMLFYVSDEDRADYVTGILHIVAQESYVAIPVNTGLKVDRGAMSVISSVNLSADTNMNVKSRNIIFVVTSGPQYGSLMAEGLEIQQFTQESLETGAVSYHHDNVSINPFDYINFTVSARDIETEGQLSIRVMISSEDIPPSVEKIEPVVVEAGKEIVLSRLNLKITHPNNLASEIVYRVVTPPKYGELRLRNEFGVIIKRSPPLGSRTARARRDVDDSVMTFTQQDVSRGLVSYVQTDYSELEDEFSFEVSNGYTTLTDLTLSIDIAPPIVPLNVHNFTVLEGRSKTISSTIIGIGHALYEMQEFTIHILDSPMHGIIENSRQAGENLKSFTTQDIANQFIYYVHDDSEETQDQFTFALNNTDGKYSEAYTIYVTVLPTNDQEPVITTNNGLSTIVGAVTPLTSASLSASDPDTPETNLTFSIMTPGNGFVAFVSSPTRAISSFTQADLSSQSLIFVQRGPRTGGFRFQVSDGVHTTQQMIFTIRATPLVLSLANNTGMQVMPGSVQPITADHLHAVTNEEPVSELSRPITFVVTREPSSGELVKRPPGELQEYMPTSSFTQEDIDRGRVAVRHHTESTLKEDSFEFDVFLPLSQNLTGVAFRLTIPLETELTTVSTPQSTTGSFEEDDSGIVNTGITVQEGKIADITTDNLDASILLEGLRGYIQYRLTEFPKHGFLSVSGRNITAKESFTQQELSMAGLQYHHDHSDTLQDSFNFSAIVKIFGSGAAGATTPSVDGTFQIDVVPINDQVFKVVTSSLRMSVVQGEQVLFNSRYLSVVDLDNSPAEITFRLHQRPSNGKLVLVSNHDASVTEFTQADVDHNKLMFIHDGGTSPGGFVFRISDGKHMQFKQFTIVVVPRLLSVTEVVPVVLLQGDSFAVVTPHNLNITSNGNASISFYNISTPADFGEIRVHSRPALSFTQHDIEEGIVTYHQTIMSSNEDELQVTLFDEYNVIPNINVTVLVKALIKTSIISAHSGSITPLLQSHLNASELAVKTQNMPLFELDDPPRLGTFINASSGEEVSRFSYADLLLLNVAYQAQRLQIDENDTMVDNCTFLLSVLNAQTVQISVDISIGPEMIKSTTPSTTSQKATLISDHSPVNQGDGSILIDVSPISYDEGSSTPKQPTGQTGPDTKPVNGGSVPILYIILAIVFIVIILFVVVVVVVWRRRHRRKADLKRREEEEEYPEKVAAAPVITTTPPQDAVVHPDSDEEDDTSQVTKPMINRPVQSPMVPQVKVTPLGRPPSPVNSYASLTSDGTLKSSAALQNFYNYPPDTIPHLGPKSPTLKKSQYWV
ncbi:chondroitin sulfate proteoglycan 4-like [Diadema antillarum]|uniref:chondroitin sulfate proteoglycan 4-like n=1 Tax=Diadema antillarum TaxID=105358 RepID=UPI003A8C328C